MNKTVVAVVVLVAMLLLAVPRAVGTFTETRVRERVAAIGANGVISVGVKSFDRGWFGSKAKIEFGLAPGYLARLGARGGPVDALGRHAMIAVDFVHGPVALQNGVHFGWSTMVARLDPETPGLAEMEKQLGVPYIFEFRGRTRFGGGVAFDADVPPMDVPAGEAQFKFSGATLDGSYVGDQLVSNTRIDSVEFAAPSGAFVLRNLRMKTDNEILSQDLAPGSAELSIGSISATDPLQGSEPLFQVDKFKLAGTSTLNAAQTLLDMQLTCDLDRLHVAENEVTGATLGLTLHNLDVETLQHYNAAMRELMSSPTATDPRVALAVSRVDLQRALAAGPSLVLDPIRLTFDGEPFEGRVEVTTDAAKLPPGGVTDLDPSVIMGLVSGKTDVKLSKALARQLVALATETQRRGDERRSPEQLEERAETRVERTLVQLVNRGLLAEDGEVYRAAVRYTDGEVTVNGNRLPLGLR